MPKVSIIVVAYNLEKYIERCLNSIILQTFKNIEIIVINDGSTDGTLEKINKIALSDSRIKIIDKKNSGVAEARKSGYIEAKGEYILFVDGDDWLSLNAIDILYNKAIDMNLDILCYKFIWAFDNKNIKSKENRSGRIDDFLKETMLNKISPSVWNKLIRRKYIVENNIEFPKNIGYAEDLAFSCSLAISRPNVHSINEYLYYYYQRNNSITNTVSNKILDIKKSTEFIKTQLLKNDLLDKYKDEYEYMAYIHNFLGIKDIIFGKNKKLGKKLYKIWKKYKINIYKNKYYKELYKNENKRTKIYLKIFEKNYYIGRMYYLLKFNL